MEPLTILCSIAALAHLTAERDLLPFQKQQLQRIQRSFVSFFEWFGNLGAFFGRLVWATITPPYEGKEFLRQFDELGAKSLPLVALAGAATGVVITLSTRDSLVRFGAKSFLPAVAIFSIIKESGPVITGLVISGRVAAGIGAELGAMKVTEQIDAMEASAVNTHKYLAATRVVACVLILPLLTLVTDFCGVLTGWLTHTLTDPISLRLFLDHGFKGMAFKDFLPPTFKTMVFGLIIGVVACFQGMRTSGGTEGVERAATSSVVLASLLIILADVLLVRLILTFFS
ncbi:MAG TPA: ABC transporter permease [Candidatus Acidoferrum sp.]|nr:ABC transporter permease [Candidatus Acidoferrum sp.]